MTSLGYFYLFAALLGALTLGVLVGDIADNAKRGDGWRVLIILFITLSFVCKLVATL